MRKNNDRTEVTTPKDRQIIPKKIPRAGNNSQVNQQDTGEVVVTALVE